MKRLFLTTLLVAWGCSGLFGALPTTLNTNQFNNSGPLSIKSAATVTNLQLSGGTTNTGNLLVTSNLTAQAILATNGIGSVSFTASRATVTDGDKVLVSSATTATEIGYVSGVSSAIQTQLNAKQATNVILTSISANLADPNADRIVFWDDSAGDFKYLTAGSGLSISGTTMTASSSQWTTSGTNIYYDDGFVGVGSVTTPVDQIHLEGQTVNGSSFNDGNARFCMGVDFNNNPHIEIQGGKTGFAQGTAIFLDFGFTDDVDYDTRFIQNIGSPDLVVAGSGKISVTKTDGVTSPQFNDSGFGGGKILASTGTEIVEATTQAPQVLAVSGAYDGNTGTTDTTLKTYAGSGAYLATAGQSLHITAGGTFAANATAKSVRIVLIDDAAASTTLFDTGSVVFNNGNWRIEVDILVTTGTSAFNFTGSGVEIAVPKVSNGITAGLDLSAYTINVMSQSGIGGADDDTVCNLFKVKYDPAP